jgi:hypothetical protein
MSILETILETLACLILFTSILLLFGYGCYYLTSPNHIPFQSTPLEIESGVPTNQSRDSAYALETILPVYDFSHVHHARGDTFVPHQMHRFPTPPISKVYTEK